MMSKLPLLISILLVAATPTYATTVDDLADAQGPLTSDDSSVVAATLGTILGGERDAELAVTGTGGSFEVAAGGPIVLLANAGVSTALGELVWDGTDGDGSTLDPTGLGAADLTAGGHDAFSLTLQQASAGAILEVEVFSSAADASRFRWTLPALDAATPAFLPYARFVPFADDGADFASVGAVVLRLTVVDGTGVHLAGPLATATATPLITANQRDLDGPGGAGGIEIGGEPRLPGGTYTYSVTIRNTGDDAVAVQFSDVLDSNLTRQGSVRATPIAVPDTYAGCGNVLLRADGSSLDRQGLLNNDQAVDGDLLTVAMVQSPSDLGGAVTLDDAATGRFTYAPPQGVTGTDTFTYVLQDSEGHQVTGTARIELSGRVWFVDSSSAGANLGSEQDPFVDLSNLDGGADADAPGETIVLVDAGAAYDGGLPLEDDQQLLGRNSLLLPCGLTASGSRPTLTHGSGTALSLASGNALDEVDVTTTSGPAIVGLGFGTATLSNSAVSSVGGRALDLETGTLIATFDALSSTDSPAEGLRLANLAAASNLAVTGATTVTNAAQESLEIVTTAAGSTLTFADASILNRDATGISIDSASGSVTFADVDIPNPDDAAGFGVWVNNSSGAVSFASLDVSDTHQSIPRTDGDGDGVPDNIDDDGHAVARVNHSGAFTLTGAGAQGDGGTLQNLDGDGIRMMASAGMTLTSITIDNIGLADLNPDTVDDAGIFAQDITGNHQLDDSTISRFETSGADRGIHIVQNGVSFTEFRVHDTTFFNALGVGGDAIRVTGLGAVDGSLIVESDVAVGDAGHHSIFHSLTGHAVRVDLQGSGAFTTQVSDSLFRDALGSGFGGIELAARGTVTMDNTVTDCVLSNLYPIGLNNGGMITFFAGESANYSAVASGCELGPSAGRGGIRAATGEQSSDTVADFDITIDGCTINDTDREPITILVSGGAVPAASGATADIKITDNRIGEAAPTPSSGREGIEIRARHDAKIMNLLIEGNVINSFANSSSDESVDIDAEDSATINATILGNTLTLGASSSATPDSLELTSEDAGASFCLDLNSDNIMANANSADDRILLDDRGTFTIEDLGANDPVTFLEVRNSANVAVSVGTPTDHGGDCPTPP